MIPKRDTVFLRGLVAPNTMVRFETQSLYKCFEFKNNNNKKLKGTWRFDKKSGTGRFAYADGDVYEGCLFLSQLSDVN